MLKEIGKLDQKEDVAPLEAPKLNRPTGSVQAPDTLKVINGSKGSIKGKRHIPQKSCLFARASIAGFGFSFGAVVCFPLWWWFLLEGRPDGMNKDHKRKFFLAPQFLECITLG